MLVLNQTWPYLLTAFFALLIGMFIKRQPERPGIRHFRWVIVVWVSWALAAALQTISRSIPVQYWLWVFQSICAMVGVPLVLLMTLAFTGSEKWGTRDSLRWLYLPAALFLLLAVFLPDLIADTHSPNGIILFSASSFTRWSFVAYIFLLILVTQGVLFASLLGAPAYQIPILVILTGQILAALGYLVLTRLHLHASPIQLTSLLVNISMLSYFLALFNYRLLRVVPVARDVIIARMPFALIVLDEENYLVDCNLKAEELPGMPQKLVLHQPAEKAIGRWWREIGDLVGSEPLEKDVVIPSNQGRQIFSIKSLPLLQPSGWRIGQSFVIEDVTQRRHAQEQLAQLQWAQATIDERELLADELHDSFSQDLAFLNLQAQAVQLYLQTEQFGSASASLDRLAGAVGGIQDDAREMIDHLLSISKPSENFCITLEQMLTDFRRQTGLETTLLLEGEAASPNCLTPNMLPPSTAVQLARITQEALTNVRKHARGSSQVLVKVAVSDDQMELTITDDGAGFEPTVEHSNGKHFGMQIMRQRVARIGGQVSIESTPGTGTQVIIRIPLSVDSSGGDL